MVRAPRFVDVRVLLAAGIPTYPGNPPFEMPPFKRVAAGDSSNNSRLTMGSHTGRDVLPALRMAGAPARVVLKR